MTCLMNLAGYHKRYEPIEEGIAAVDRLLEEELFCAEIDVVRADEPYDNEVTTHITGELCGFIFSRAWRYWVVKGPMPMDLAKKIHAHPFGLQVRVKGHAAAPDPEQYCSGQAFVGSYHIDTLAGLCLLARHVRNL